jgi:glycolate oxidase
MNGISPEALKRVREELAGIVGPAYVRDDQENRQKYGSDETEDLSFPPDLVVFPADAGEISRIFRVAGAYQIAVTPRGGGTGLSGGALPVHAGIVLSLERMNRILSIDTANLQATVQPGVTTQRLQEEVEALGLFYPPDPASRGTCQIGGNLAECAGGPRAVKYGVTKDYILELEAVLPTGEIITCGAPVLKNVTGYNLTQLLIGSEGTLAVVTRAVVRLIPLPRARQTLLVAFHSLEDAAAAVAAIFQAGITPSALEFMERAAVKAAEDRQGKRFPNGEAGAQLFIEVDGGDAEMLTRDAEEIAAVVERCGALDMVVAADKQKTEEVWNLRRGIGEAVKSISAYKEEDTVVPRAHLPQLVAGVKEICGRWHITSICYGHAGDGNVHVNLLRLNMSEGEWESASDRAIEEIFRLTISLGGTISGEHGIGYSQKRYLPLAVGQTELELMKRIKAAFDPQGILNPGKMFP